MINFVCFHVNAGHFPVFRTREVLNDVVKQSIHSLAKHIRSHAHRHNTSITHICPKGCSNFRLRESFTAKVALHHLFTGLRHWFHKGVAAKLQVCLIVLRNLTFHHILALPPVACLGNDIYISYKFFIFTDWQMERRHLLSKHLRHILHNLPERSIVNIHVAHINHTGQLIFLAQLPCLLGTNFHTGFAVYNNNSRAGCTDCFLNLTGKIKKSRCIQYINLIPFPFYRNYGSADRYFSLLFFFAKITDCISIIDLTHPRCYAR